MGLPEFSAYAPATLVSAREVAAEQAVLTVQPPPGFAEAHQRAGQFCMIRVGEDHGIFAMASAPGGLPLRFLVRTHADAAAAARLSTMPDDAPLEMTGPAGPGFDLSLAAGRDVYLVATGTGVAPVCAAIDVLLADRASYGRVHLIHGVRSDAHLAIAASLEGWTAAGLESHVCFSTFENGVLHGTSVQAALGEAAPDLKNAAVLAVGQSAMLSELREIAAALGLAEDRFLTNL